MAVTSIFINATLPVISGMKKLSDFEMQNYFSDIPATAAAWSAGFYFGDDNNDITSNSFDLGSAATVTGTPVRNGDYLTLSGAGYLDTGLKMPASFSFAGTLKRPATATASSWICTDFMGSGASGSGFAVGIANGQLVVGNQNGESTLPRAFIDIPASIAVGGDMGIVAYIQGTTLYGAIYNPVTQTLVSATATSGNARVASTRNALLGAKYDLPPATSIQLKTALLTPGDIGTDAQKLALLQYLLAK